MINEKDILNRLMSGENPDDIASEFATALNNALAAKRQQSESAQRHSAMVADLQGILDDLMSFCITYYCETEADMDKIENIFNELSAEKVLSDMEEISAFVANWEQAFQDLPTVLKLTIPEEKKEKSEPEPMTTQKCHAILNNFLNTLGL